MCFVAVLFSDLISIRYISPKVGKMVPYVFKFKDLFESTFCCTNLKFFFRNIWDKVFKNGPSEICGRQPLRNFVPLLKSFFQITILIEKMVWNMWSLFLHGISGFFNSLFWFRSKASWKISMSLQRKPVKNVCKVYRCSPQRCF